MTMRKILLSAAPLVLSAPLFFGCATSDSVYEEPEPNANVVVPPWAPSYDDVRFVRYYYLPDIEVYYDVWNQEFAYLQDGNWMFAPSLPPLYAGFDLYDCFVVVLDRHVYEPWMHHQNYVSHYPRYYYHSVYNVTDRREIRGFNENREREIRLKQEERVQLNQASTNRQEHEKVQPAPQQRKPESTRAPQRMKYYGQDIGKPVKVEKHMTKPRETGQKRK